MFRLINLHTQEFLENERTSLIFADGKRAGRAAKIATMLLNVKVQVRRVEPGDDKWREREQARFVSGEYVALETSLSHWSAECFPDHFAHVAKKRPDLIAYTKSEEKGRADKQSLMSIEAYVKLVAEHEKTDWGCDTQRAIIKRHRAHASVAEKPYLLATTPDEIAEVYTNYAPDAHQVSTSCMRYPKGHWARVDGARYHPASVYGAGDLAIAYIANDEGQTVARALVWPDKKLYSRVYADSDQLSRLLKADGYERSRYYGFDHPLMEGARLLRIETEGDDLVCPYLDEHPWVEDDGEFLRIGGDLDARRTDGTLRQRAEYSCENCGDDVHDEDDLYTVWTDSRMRDSAQWCRHCYEDRTFYCEGERETFDQSVPHTTVGDNTYTDRYLERNAVWCQRNSEWTFDPIPVIVDTKGTIEMWSDDAAADYATSYNGEYYSDDIDTTTVVVERYVSNFDWGWRNRSLLVSNAWFVDRVQEVPTHLIDNGKVDVVEGSDGRSYLRGYVDHYPVDRPRMDVDLVTMMEANEYLEAA